MSLNPDGQSFDLTWEHGATHLIVGPSSSGKTVRVSQILAAKNVLIKDGVRVRNVVFCYAAWQPEYEELSRRRLVTKWIKKMPTAAEFVELVRHYAQSVVIIDDFQSEINQDLDTIVRVYARHYRASTFILFQSLFPPYKFARQISLNVKYLHVAKNPREASQFRYLAMQLRPGDFHWLLEAYSRATVEPFSWFLADFTMRCDDRLRFRSSYIPAVDSPPMKVWLKKGTV